MLQNTFILRDSIDLARTITGRFMNFLVMEILTHLEKPAVIKEIGEHYRALLSATTELLSLTEDFSILATLRRLRDVAPTNPDFEITLKRNIGNLYCIQPAYELAAEIFLPEAELVFDTLAASAHTEMPDFHAAGKAILERFMKKPLAGMQPEKTVSAAQALLRAAESIEGLQKYFLRK